MPNASCADTRVFASPVETQTVYLTLNCPQGGDIYKSADRGANWGSVKGNLADDLHVTALAINPEDPEILVAGDTSGNVFRSTNGGLVWAPLGKPDSYISDLAFNPFGDHEPWAAGADSNGHWGNLWKYVDTAWTQVPLGTAAQNQATSILFSPATADTLWVGTMQGAFQSTNSGDTWTPLSAEAWHVSASALDPPGHTGQARGVQRPGDLPHHRWRSELGASQPGPGGRLPERPGDPPRRPGRCLRHRPWRGHLSEQGRRQHLAQASLDNLIPSVPLVDPFNPQRVYVAAGGNVEISPDEGANWHKATPPLPPGSPSTWGVRVISLLALDQPGRLLMGAGFADSAAPSWGYADGGIYTSLDYGESWSYVDMGQGQDGMPVAVLAVDPSHPATVYAGTGYCCPGQGNGVWKARTAAPPGAHLGWPGCKSLGSP